MAVVKLVRKEIDEIEVLLYDKDNIDEVEEFLKDIDCTLYLKNDELDYDGQVYYLINKYSWIVKTKNNKIKVKSFDELNKDYKLKE